MDNECLLWRAWDETEGIEVTHEEIVILYFEDDKQGILVENQRLK